MLVSILPAPKFREQLEANKIHRVYVGIHFEIFSVQKTGPETKEMYERVQAAESKKAEAEANGTE